MDVCVLFDEVGVSCFFLLLSESNISGHLLDVFDFSEPLCCMVYVM